jgi:monoamine oxidase
MSRSRSRQRLWTAGQAADHTTGDDPIARTRIPHQLENAIDASSQGGFDTLKQTAITQLGAGRNAKLNLQFTSRPWNASGSTGSLYSDQSFQSAWEVTRGQSGTAGILVEYPGATVAQSMGQSNPYTTTATNSQVTTYANQFLSQIEPIFPGITAKWNGKAMLSTPFTDPNFLCSYSYWKPGQYTGFSGYEGMRQGNIHFAGEHCSISFQGFMEGGASEGVRAANEILTDLKCSSPQPRQAPHGRGDPHPLDSDGGGGIRGSVVPAGRGSPQA